MMGRVEQAGIVTLTGQAAEVVVHLVRVTVQQIGRLGDPQLTQIARDGRADVWDVFEAAGITTSLCRRGGWYW